MFYACHNVHFKSKSIKNDSKKKMQKVFVNVYLFMTCREKQSILEQIHVMIGEASPTKVIFHLRTCALMTVRGGAASAQISCSKQMQYQS